MSRRIDRSEAARRLEELNGGLEFSRDETGALVPFTALPEQATGKIDGRWFYFRLDDNIASLQVWDHGEGTRPPAARPLLESAVRVYYEAPLRIGVFFNDNDLVTTFQHLMAHLRLAYPSVPPIIRWLALPRG